MVTAITHSVFSEYRCRVSRLLRCVSYLAEAFRLRKFCEAAVAAP
jgi:hypothetical protein